MSSSGLVLALGGASVLAALDLAACRRGGRNVVALRRKLDALDAALSRPAGSGNAAAAPRAKAASQADRIVEAFTQLDPRDVPDDLLLAVLLSGATRRGVAPRAAARKLLDEIGGIERLAQDPTLSRADEDAVTGLTSAGHARLVAANELARRAAYRANLGRVSKVENTTDTVRLLQSMALGPYESFVAIYLDKSLRLIASRVLTRGSDRATVVDPRQILSIGLRLGASGILVAHNHPSGLLRPSRDDIAATRRLEQAAGSVGVDLLDHILVTEAGHLSFREGGLMGA